MGASAEETADVEGSLGAPAIGPAAPGSAGAWPSLGTNLVGGFLEADPRGLCFMSSFFCCDVPAWEITEGTSFFAEGGMPAPCAAVDAPPVMG